MKFLSNRMLHSVEFYGIILCILLFGSYYSLSQTDKREIWVAHSNEILMHLTLIQLLSAKSELYARTHSRSGEPSVIKQFDSISANAISELRYIKYLVKDNLSIRPTLDSVQLYLIDQIDFQSKMINTPSREGLSGSQKLIAAEQEAAKTRKFAKFIKQIDDSEKDLMKMRMAQSAKAAQRMNFSLLLTAIFVPVLLIIRIRRVRKESNERALLLKELLINAERMKKAEKLASFGVWDVNLQNGNIISSDEMYRIWGYEPGKIRSTLDNYLVKVHPDDYNFVRKKMRGLTDQKGTDDYTFRILDDGRTKTVSAGTAVLRDEEGELLSITGYAQDITEKTVAALDLAIANKELKTLFNRIGDVLFSRDVRRNCFIQISETCLQIYGYSADEFMNDVNLWQTIIHPDDQHLVQQGNGVLQDGQQFIIQYRVVHKDGTERWVENSMVPSMDADKKLVRFDGVVRDITIIKLQTIERLKMIDDLIQRNSTLEQFAYIISHHLRAPVANIIGLGEIFKTLDNGSSEMLEIQVQIVKCIGKLDTMVCDLNLVLRVREQVNEKKQMIYFKDMLADVISSLPYLQEMDNIDIRSNFEQAGEIYSVRGYISNIFYNLILNSINYRRDNVRTSILITSALTKTGVNLTFKDNGRGIDLANNRSSLFDLYSRFDESVVGKGMGLFMVKTQIELLGGSVEVESDLNFGTRFIIRLPITNDTQRVS